MSPLGRERLLGMEVGTKMRLLVGVVIGMPADDRRCCEHRRDFGGDAKARGEDRHSENDRDGEVEPSVMRMHAAVL